MGVGIGVGVASSSFWVALQPLAMNITPRSNPSTKFFRDRCIFIVTSIFFHKKGVGEYPYALVFEMGFET
jgi:hypothetical protein